MKLTKNNANFAVVVQSPINSKSFPFFFNSTKRAVACAERAVRNSGEAVKVSLVALNSTGYFSLMDIPDDNIDLRVNVVL